MATIRRLPVKPKTPNVKSPPPFISLENRLRKELGEAAQDIDSILTRIKSNIADQMPKEAESELSDHLIEMRGRFQKRIRDTLVQLAKRSHLNTDEEKNLEAISKLMSQLVQFLSVDFYRDVLKSLSAVDKEEDHDAFGLDESLIKKIKPFFDFLYYKYWRVDVTGIDNIPAQGPALLVANHSGTLPYDGSMIKAAILNEHPVRKDARFLIEDFVYHFPFLGTFMYRIGGVRASPDNAERLLREGHLVIVFPEGVKGIGKLFKERYRLQRFGRGGFVKLALRTGAPIIPVSVVGAEEIHPLIYKSRILAKPLGIPYVPVTPTMPLLGPLGLVPLPSKWFLHFGKPIYLKAFDTHAKDENLYIHQISEQVRHTVQDMVSTSLSKRQSIWWG